MSTANTSAMQGKVILLTGATEGIGKAAARALAKKQATLVLVGRNAAKTQSLVTELKRESGNERVEAIVGDLSRMADVRAIAAEFKSRHDRLDVLANNAGGIFTSRTLTADGFELTFALNHLSYFLLTNELLDVLKKTPGARIVNTSSGAHSRGKLDDLTEFAKRDRHYRGLLVYSDSKLANVYFTQELARRLQGSDVVANCFHPGFVRTGFAQNNSGSALARGFALGGSLLGRTPEKGAETLIWLATSEEGGKISGEYFFDRAVQQPFRAYPTLLIALAILGAGTVGGWLSSATHLPTIAGEIGLPLAMMSIIRRGRPLRTVPGNDDIARKLWAFSEQACGIQSS